MTQAERPSEAPLNVEAFDEVHLGKAGELLPGLVQTWLNEDG